MSQLGSMRFSSSSADICLRISSIRGALLALVVELVDEGESFEDEAALGGVVVDFVDDFSPPVGDAVGADDLVAPGQSAREAVAHLDGRGGLLVGLLVPGGEELLVVFSTVA